MSHPLHKPSVVFLVQWSFRSDLYHPFGDQPHSTKWKYLHYCLLLFHLVNVLKTGPVLLRLVLQTAVVSIKFTWSALHIPGAPNSSPRFWLNKCPGIYILKNIPGWLIQQGLHNLCTTVPKPGKKQVMAGISFFLIFPKTSHICTDLCFILNLTLAFLL